MRNVLLVWVIGLTLGIAAGAATAMLLMPDPALGANPDGLIANRQPASAPSSMPTSTQADAS